MSSKSLGVYSPYDISYYTFGKELDDSCKNWRTYKEVDGSIGAIAECGLGNFIFSKIDYDTNKITVTKQYNRWVSKEHMYTYFPKQELFVTYLRRWQDNRIEIILEGKDVTHKKYADLGGQEHRFRDSMIASTVGEDYFLLYD